MGWTHGIRAGDRMVEHASPVGPLTLVASDAGLVALLWRSPGPPLAPGNADPVLAETRQQLDTYFAGRLTRFDLPLGARGTPFQRRVWAALALIPFGETRSYAQIATGLGQPTATRAVGAANGRNPRSIVVPCHRVIGADGSLTGFGGGIAAKRFLLDLEGIGPRQAVLPV
jgi:methylated-DNA-[protein]-cysteine S-methyltransferase